MFLLDISHLLGMKTKVGQRLGWGIHYNPERSKRSDFDDKAEQLVVCFVTIDVNIVHAEMIVQPEGGFFPVVILNPSGKYSSKLADL